jgi:hypothetical protein
VIKAKYIARLFVRIVIVSQHYHAAFVAVRASYVEILNDEQILPNTNMKFGKEERPRLGSGVVAGGNGGR